MTPLNLSTPSQPNQSLLCALCLSAPLRESKQRRARRRNGKRKPLQGGDGREWEGEGHLWRGTDLTQRRGEAESAERKVETTMENERAGDISRRILSPWTSRLDCLSTSAGRSSSINPMNLCALCLSAPLRESKTTTREIRRILCPLNPMPPLNLTTPLNPMNLCALCLSAPLRESKTTTCEIRRILCPLNPMTPLNLTPPSTQSISALSASPRLCVRQKRRNGRRAPGRRQTHPPSGIMLTAAANNRQRRNNQAGDRKLKLQDVKETKR